MIHTHPITLLLPSKMLQDFICIHCLGKNLTGWFSPSVSISPWVLCMFCSGSSGLESGACPLYFCCAFHKSISKWCYHKHYPRQQTFNHTQPHLPGQGEQTELYIQMKMQEQVETGRKYRTGNLAGTHSITTALGYLITGMVRTVILALQMKD